MVASNSVLVGNQPEVISESVLRADSLPSPESRRLAVRFGELHPILSCLSSPMESSPCLTAVDRNLEMKNVNIVFNLMTRKAPPRKEEVQPVQKPCSRNF